MATCVNILSSLNDYFCNVPDPLTGEEDATNTKHTGKQPHEHEHAYNAEIKRLNIIHTKIHNP